MNTQEHLKRVGRQFLPPEMRRLILRRAYQLQGKHIVNVFHISKTGGTAFKYAVRNHTVTQSHAILLHGDEIGLADIPHGESIIFFLRDPAARFVSAFRFRQRQGQPRYYAPWTPEECAAFAEFDTPNELALALSAHDAGKRERAASAMLGIDVVNTSYTKWIASAEELRRRAPDILHIGFQESLSSDFEYLKVQLGLPDDLELPTDPVAANRAPSAAGESLDEIAIRNLKNWYAVDYELVAVCKELLETRQGR